MFDLRCQENSIAHWLTKITIREATVQRYHYDRHDQLESHLADFINAYNYARRLKTLKGLTPYEYICKCWTSQPERFKTQSAPANAETKHLKVSVTSMVRNGELTTPCSSPALS
jgi:hypothetical protein